MKIGNELVSVVITAHNEERTIERAIKSVLAQDYSPLEIIVVDDGSTDCTYQKIVNTVSKNSNAKILRNEAAQGLMAARNLGVSMSAGKYIGFLDGDDEWHCEKAKIQTAFINKLGKGSILFTSRIIYSERGKPRIFKKKSWSNKIYYFSYNQVLEKHKLLRLGASMMFERNTFEHLGGFDEGAGKERDFTARVGVCGGSIAWLGVPLYIQHRKKNSMSTDILKTYERELNMIECWRPQKNRHWTRAISEKEFNEYKNSIIKKYQKQLFLKEKKYITNVAAENKKFMKYKELSKLILHKTVAPSYHTAKQLMAYCNYLYYKNMMSNNKR